VLNWLKLALVLKLFPVLMEVVGKLVFVRSASYSSNLSSLNSVHIDLEVSLNRDWFHFFIYRKSSKIICKKLLRRACLVKVF